MHWIWDRKEITFCFSWQIFLMLAFQLSDSLYLHWDMLFSLFSPSCISFVFWSLSLRRVSLFLPLMDQVFTQSFALIGFLDPQTSDYESSFVLLGETFQLSQDISKVSIDKSQLRYIPSTSSPQMWPRQLRRALLLHRPQCLLPLLRPLQHPWLGKGQACTDKTPLPLANLGVHAPQPLSRFSYSDSLSEEVAWVLVPLFLEFWPTQLRRL